MSQSDYLHHKKISLELKSQNKLSPVLSGMNYTLYKQYSLEKNIKNTSKLYNQLVPTGTQVIFNIISTNSDNCPEFVLCKNTNLRQNRITNTLIDFAPSPEYVKLTKNRTCVKCCNTKPVTSNTNTMICSNKRWNDLCNCGEL